MSASTIDPATLTFARKLARIKARQLRRLLPGQSIEDLEQELLLEVLAGWGRYDPERGRAEPFIERLVQQKAWKLLRDRRQTAERRQRVFQLGDHDQPDPADEVESACLRHDVGMAVAALPPRLRDACEQLRRESVSTVARAQGVPRSTLDSSLRKVRAAFAHAGLAQYLS